MGSAFTPGLQIKGRTLVRRERELPLSGKILVREGDQVQADTIVAEAELPGELQILRISESMGLEPFEVFKGLQVRVGDTVQEGQVICEHAGIFGLFRSTFKAPVDGTIELITERTGHVALRLAPEHLQVDAYIPGRVVAVRQNRAVTIEAEAAFIQGIFGVGGERKGKLLVLDVAPDAEITDKDIPAQVKGCILVGGTRPSIEAIQKAVGGGAVGLVTGAVDDRTLARYLGYDLGIALTGDEKVPMTLIITEGFGTLALASRTLTLFKSLQGQEASINGATQVRAGALRPEIIATAIAQSSNDSQRKNSELCVGSEIRIIRVPYFGVYAEVIELPREMETLPTGASARILKAKLANGEIVVVPRANVELV